MIFHTFSDNCMLSNRVQYRSCCALAGTSPVLKSKAYRFDSYLLTLCPLGKFSCFLSSADFFFQNQLFRKTLSGIPPECQKDWIKIRPNILSSLIWVQSVCKGCEQATLVGKELNHNANHHKKNCHQGLPRTR